MSVLVKNGRVVTADRDYVADVFVEDETITAIGQQLTHRADRVIDATGKLVMPGGVDVHTHLEAPVGGTVSSDDFESGTRAAAFGGTTCIIDFATQTRGERLSDTLELWREKGKKAVIDYGLHMIVTDVDSAPLEGIEEVVHEGVASFKLFMAYPGVLMIDDATILRVMQQAGRLGALVCVHAEDGPEIDRLVRQALIEGRTSTAFHAFTRPASTEAEATASAIRLAHSAGVPVYIVHVTCVGSVEEIARAQSLGQPVFAETCPQYLFLSVSDLCRPNFEGAKYVLTPPLREARDQARLWAGLQQDTLHVVSTDHCPFNFHGQKDLGRQDFTKIPNGGPGIENRLQLLYHFGVNQRRLALNRFVNIVSTMPAKLFGLYPRKGVVEVGSDADLVIWDPAQEFTISAHTHHMRVDYSMYEGITVQGNADIVLSRGEVIVEKGSWLGAAGRGRFLKRKCFAAAWDEKPSGERNLA